MNGGNEGELAMKSYALEFLVHLVENAGFGGISLTKALLQLENLLHEKGVENYQEVAEQVVNHTLNSWIIDKVIDYTDDDSKEEYEWFLTILSKEETEKFKNLSEEKKAFIRILRNYEVDGRLGLITEADAFEALRIEGHDVEFIPFIAGKTDDFMRSTEEGPIIWHYLVPRYELEQKKER